MAQIKIQDMTFIYTGSLYPVFENVNLSLDTNWRLGLVGRNGRGKTTLLNLLRGKLKPNKGALLSPEEFEYFPVAVEDETARALDVARRVVAPFDDWEAEMRRLLEDGSDAAIGRYGDIEEAYSQADGYIINEKIEAETGKLGMSKAVLEQAFGTLSGGEKVKLLLAALFLKKHRFLLIDEPTDHLDAAGRRLVARWLSGKSGFILVSHDRLFLDEAVDHIMAINRADIELQAGNYTSWRQNRDRQDEYEADENRRLEREIKSLKAAAERTEKWSDKVEKTKIGNANTTYSGGPPTVNRGRIGHQAAKMMQRSKAIVRRQERQIDEKQTLLKNVETAEPLKFLPLVPEKNPIIRARGLGFAYGGRAVLRDIDLDIAPGDRIAVTGTNGSGKTTLLRLLLGQMEPQQGELARMNGLVISQLAQETGFLQGDLKAFAQNTGVDVSLMLAILRKLDFEREAFERKIEHYSAGQKKKVCLAASLAKPAHLYIWDEPLNYIDVLSREQIESAILESAPTMVFVEHDQTFTGKVATKTITVDVQPQQ